MSKKIEKSEEYAISIIAVIEQLFNEESEFYIDKEDLMEGNNATDFIHALCNIMPNHIFNKITDDKKNLLEFNHIANRLCFQYGNKTNK